MNLDIATAPRFNSLHWKVGQISWDELVSWTDEPDTQKDCGNYVLGVLRRTDAVHSGTPCSAKFHRRKEAVVSRSALSLDIDTPDPSFVTDLLLELDGVRFLLHTTYSSTSVAPRYRLIVPLDRSVSPDEYFAAASVLMDRLGWESFDPGSVQPERYMFRPAAGEPMSFQRWIGEGEAQSADELIGEWTPEQLEAPRPSANKRNPYDIDGVVGAFNRAYTFDEAISAFSLPYESAGADRWRLAGAVALAGMSVVSDGIVYSHHASDPAGGQACSAFDLVRLHNFGYLDADAAPKTPVNRLPSHMAMLELATTDARVVAEIVGVDFDEAMSAEDDAPHPDDWKLGLRLSPRTGKFVDCIENWDLVRANDPVFRALYYNELTFTVEVDAALPWRPLARGGAAFSGTDRAALCHYLERTYKLRPPRSLVDELVDVTAHARYVNPVKDYLDDLVWDGTPRLETCLPGVRPTPYTRMVARKSLVAAVARIMVPGIKWDHTLVLFGPEGLGKSWWVEKVSLGHSASLGRIGDKDTLLTMHRSWIMLADESNSLRKADADIMKEFLTRTEDTFRMPYDRETVPHKRRCVIWGTTNDEVFLRRQEGNRRFLIVKCEDKVDFDGMTDEYIAQLWAEAVHLFKSGERLFLEGSESDVAAAERERFTEEDALAGLIQEYLDTPVPSDWDELSPDARQLWLQNRSDGMVPEGTERITRTCSLQIWVEALGKRLGDHRRSDLLEINTALKQLPSWRALSSRQRLPHYGPQLVFARVEDEGDVL